ncbi:MAG: ChaN family lipoprotein [Planctomycetota bacterium]|jgi:uncharacterized iron-regulated protein
MRTLTIALAVVIGLSVVTQAEEGAAEISLKARYEYQSARFMRELWVAVPSSSVESKDMLKALRKVASETTTVAVLRPQYSGLAESESERQVLKQIQLRASLKDLQAALNFHPHNKTRTVVVGFHDGALDALNLAASSKTRAEGVVLLDPPIAALEEAEVDSRKRLGVDVLIHPASTSDFEEQEERIREALGSWGGSARVIESENPLDSIEQRLGEVWQVVRGYSLPEPRAELMAKLAEFDVVIVGELHGNPGAHALQFDALKKLASSGGTWALAMEQFERDVQPHLTKYVSVQNPKDRKELVDARLAFVSKSRPWPNYADYKPMIELCRTTGLPVIAANVPRPLAARINKGGPEVMADFTDDEKAWCARSLIAQEGGYKDKFFGLMGDMASHGVNLDNMYASQCIKDDTMAESIVHWIAAGENRKALLTVGRFHSAEGLGVPEKIRGLNPDLKVAILTCGTDDDDLDLADNEWFVTVPSTRKRSE